jgi:hypothetical protein
VGGEEDGDRMPVTAQASAQAGHMRSAKAWARRGSSAQPAMKSTVKLSPTAAMRARR